MRGVRQARAALVAATLSVALALAGCGSESGGGGQRVTKIDGAQVTWGEPSGDPVGVVLLVHGGGWQPSRSGYEEQKASAETLQGQGYATAAIAYDAGTKGFNQLVDLYEQARKRYPGLPICASGISAGANLSLMLATREPQLRCVIALSAPTDLTTLAAQDPEGDEAYQAAVTAFGTGRLASFSPVRYADRIKAKVLLIAAESDPTVPAAQARELAQALPDAQLLVLPPGPVPVEWAHFGRVQPDAQNTVIERELDFLRSATQGG
jgi:acetyl esterase/lipase